jgi:cGMP-dependent protein kinase
MVPFGEDFEDPYEVYQLITHNTTLKYPKYFDPTANKAAKSMMEQLLNRIPEARLGGSYATLKAHKWFEKFDWVEWPHSRTNFWTWA